MDFDVDDEGSTNGSESMDVRSVSELATCCQCGAYDKIMVASQILRNRIIDAVNNEIDQYEQPLAVLLRSSEDAPCTDDVASADSQQTSEESKGTPPYSSQSQSPGARLTPDRSQSIDLIVNDIVVNASLLLLSKLK